MKRNAIKAATALAILILAAGCAQSPTAPAPGDQNNGLFAMPYG
jgi:hypothetical protein